VFPFLLQFLLYQLLHTHYLRYPCFNRRHRWQECSFFLDITVLKICARFVHSWEINHPPSTSSEFATIILLYRALRPILKPGRPSVCVYTFQWQWTSYTPRHRDPISSPSTIHSPAIETEGVAKQSTKRNRHLYAVW
jgi:hypothetical protein